MKALFKFLLFVAILVGAYFYFVPGASVSDFAKLIPKPQKIDPATGKPLIECATCQATGQVKCTARGCVDGKVECNGPCMRLTKGRWVKDPKLGHGPDELWMVFPEKNGFHAWTKNHVGEVVEMRNGMAVNLGACKICGGTTRIPCKICQGTALVTCKVCQGRKEIPDMKVESTTSIPEVAKAATPVPVSSNPPTAALDVIHLKNGTTISGRIVIKDENVIVIRTADGKSQQVPVADLAR